MPNQTVEQSVREMDDAFNRGDIDALLDFYEDGAIVVAEPGKLARGKVQLRQIFQSILSDMKGSAKQQRTYVIENGDIALVRLYWIELCEEAGCSYRCQISR